jgi:K+-sensing histidine kinase KdpD
MSFSGSERSMPDRPDRHERDTIVGGAQQSRPGLPGRVNASYAIAVIATLAIVLTAEPIRERVDPVAAGFGFLLLVLACVGLGGLGPGITASVLAFLAFNFFSCRRTRRSRSRRRTT